MRFTSPHLHRRSIMARLAGFSTARRHDGMFIDRNTSPTDFVLRDYRHVR